MKYLVIKSSLMGESSVSNALVNKHVADLTANGHEVLERDLNRAPIAHLDAETFTAWQTEPNQRDPVLQHKAALSDQLIGELRAADVVLIAAPMYNFGVPSPLKAWIDQIARAGHTFRYTDSGPQGLLTGKRGILVLTRGGQYAGTAIDTQQPYLTHLLQFLGIEQVDTVFAEGLAMGLGDQTTAEAKRRLETLLPVAA